jgi:hypothetical protein
VASLAGYLSGRVLRYSVGNENNPADPWGRSELAIQGDGTARLDHHFSRRRQARAWTGRVEPAALEALRAALDRAGFPVVPGPQPVAPDTSLRRLTAESDDGSQQAIVGWHQAPSLPGYAEAFDLLDGMIRQLSGGAVAYPSTQPPIVGDITSC